VIKTCPSLFAQYQAAYNKIPTNAEKNKGSQFRPAPIDIEGRPDEPDNHTPDTTLLLKSILEKL